MQRRHRLLVSPLAKARPHPILNLYLTPRSATFGMAILEATRAEAAFEINKFAGCLRLTLQFRDHAGAIAMTLDRNPRALEHRESGVAKRRILFDNNVFTKPDAGAATGQNCRAIRQVVTSTDVAAVGNRHVVEQPAAIRFLRRF